MSWLKKTQVVLTEFWWWFVGLFRPKYILLDIFIEMLGKALEKRKISHDILVRRKTTDVYIVAIRVVFYSGDQRLRHRRTFQLEFKNGKTQHRDQAREYCKNYIDIFLENLHGYFLNHKFVGHGVR